MNNNMNKHEKFKFQRHPIRCKTKFITPPCTYDSLYLLFEIKNNRMLTGREIKNVLKVLNRPGYLNGINHIYFDTIISYQTEQKILNGIKGFKNSQSLMPPKYISFYEPGIEYGYAVSERYLL